MFGYWDGLDGLVSGLPLFTLGEKESWRLSQIWLLSSELKHRLVSRLNERVVHGNMGMGSLKMEASPPIVMGIFMGKMMMHQWM